MNYNEWQQRITHRSDMTLGLVHLTKRTKKESALDVLVKILKDKKLQGGRGFVCGKDPVVCFQDAPLHSISENIFYEQQIRKETHGSVRYDPCGLRFSKAKIYKSGGRPVIYELTNTAKGLIKEDEHWRIVCLNLNEADNIIDWTHEREWRIKGDFSFEWEDVEILLSQEYSLSNFIEACDKNGISDLLTKIKGITTLKSNIF